MSDYDDQERYEANDTVTQEEDESSSSSGVDEDYPPSTNHLDIGDGENDLLSASNSYRDTLMVDAQQQFDSFDGKVRSCGWHLNDNATYNQRHGNNMVESYSTTHRKMMLETDGSNESLAKLISSYENRMKAINDDAIMGGTVTTTTSDETPGEALGSIFTSPPSTIPAITTPGTVTRVTINDATSRVASSSNNADHLGMSLFSPVHSDLQPRTTNTNEEEIGGLPSSDEHLFIPPVDGGTTSTEGVAATASGTNAIDGTDPSNDRTLSAADNMNAIDGTDPSNDRTLSAADNMNAIDGTDPSNDRTLSAADNMNAIDGTDSSTDGMLSAAVNMNAIDGTDSSTDGTISTMVIEGAIDGTDSSTDGTISTMVIEGAITAIGAIVSKVCVVDGIAYQGCIISYDVKSRLYLIQYNANRPDCDKEELNEAQVAKYKIRDYSSTDTDNSDDEDEHEDDEDVDDDSPSDDDDDDDRLTQNHRLSGCRTTKSMSESSYIDSSSDNS